MMNGNLNEVKTRAYKKLFLLWYNMTIARREFYSENSKSAKEDYDYYSKRYFDACELFIEIGLVNDSEVEKAEDVWRKNICASNADRA